jgi:hypothetical protein
MSTIDTFKHKALGCIECPSDYPIMSHNDESRTITIYRIDEDVTGPDFVAKAGDILVGGGSGEASAFRISIPEAIIYYTTEQMEDSTIYDVVKPFWSPNETFASGNGYVKLGWKAKTELFEDWLAQHTLSFLVNNFEDYKKMAGSTPFDYNGSVAKTLGESGS